MPTFAVIGAGYGDEGKGLVTDYLARQNHNCVVIRSNGGAQAGHTVTLKDGRRHVFGHIGSGTLAGADTHLSKHFIINPILLENELIELEQFKCIPKISCDPGAIFSTVWDMAVNQIEAYINKKTNTCGVGIHTTLQRLDDCNLLMLDLCDYHNSTSIFKVIRESCLKLLSRKKIALSNVPSYFRDIFESEVVLTSVVENWKRIKEKITFETDSNIQNKYYTVIFEGAQGLLLDQRRKEYPYVTPSNTGTRNIKTMLKNDAFIEMYYVTRCYKTRHGDGPFPTETTLPFDINDTTNIPNKFQGILRTGLLDVPELVKTINEDWNELKHVGTKSLVVTCMDQPNDLLPFIGKRGGQTKLELINETSNCDFYSVLYSCGPTAENITNTTGIMQFIIDNKRGVG